VNVDRSQIRRTSKEEQVLAELDQAFEPYNQRLAEVTGLDLSSWASTSMAPMG
jgi:hypothetical protein